MDRRSIRHLIWLLLLLSLGSLAAAQGWSPEVPRILSIDFRGNDSIRSGELRSVMRLHQPAWWNPFRRTPYLGSDYLTLDLYRVLDRYRDRGFPLAMVEDVEVAIDDALGTVRILIEIREGPRCRVNSVRISGIEDLLLPKAEDRIPVKIGSLLRSSVLRSAREKTEALLAEAGYLGAWVRTDVKLRGTSADVGIRVVEGPLFKLRSVVIDSAGGPLVRTDPEVVLREIAVGQGETVRTSKILKSQNRLFETGVFRTIRVLPVPDSLGASLADLRIVVNELNSGWYGFGAGYSSDDRIRLLAEWGHRNLLRRARRLVVDGDISFSLNESSAGSRSPIRSSLARIRYTEPWLFSTRTRSVTSLYHTYEREARSDDKETVFDLDITGLEEKVSRSIGLHSTLGFGLTNKWVRTGDPSAAREKYQTRNVSVLLQEDRRDNFLDPTRGTDARVLGEYAGGLLGGQNEFSRWTVSGSWYRAVRGRWILAMRIRAGWILPVGKGASDVKDTLSVARVPFEERFMLGGGTTVRGYPDNSLGRLDPDDDLVIGGTSLLLGNLELRFPILWALKGAVFFDAGNVWADPEEIKLSRFRDGFDSGKRSRLNVAYSVGGGLRIVTPVGPFRVDYGFQLGGGQEPGGKSGSMHLSLGQAF